MDAAAHSRRRELLALVSDSSRWRILRLLRTRPHTVGEIVDQMHIAQPAVSHHLRRLRGAGLVETRVEGRLRRYSWASGAPGSTESDLARLLGDWFSAAPDAAHRGGVAGGSRVPVRPIEVHLL